jgi:predicted solute-binding protein
LLHESLATSPLTYPFENGWLAPAREIIRRPHLEAADVPPDAAALLPSSEITLLQETHLVHPAIAVIAEQRGTVALRTPARPDEIEPTPVHLLDTSGSAELLARATLEQFYGILPTGWTRSTDGTARAVVVEGALALRAPEAGYAEDLVRAWYILTGQPWVSHLLAVPRDALSDEIETVVGDVAQALAVSHERRRDLRRELAERHDVDRDLLTDAFAAQRYRLDEPDRRALLMLLQKGNRGSAYPYPWGIAYTDEETSATL